MLIYAGGQSGTIGGGALEHRAARGAFDAARVQQIALGPALGQCCGGAVSLVTEVFDTVAQVPTTGHFARMIDGPEEMPLSIRRHLAQTHAGQSTGLIWRDGWLCEPVAPARTPLWIWGAGHVGRALIDVLSPLPEFALTWIDTNLARYPEIVPPSVTVLPAENPADLVAHAPRDAQHLILTYSHKLDLDLCHGLLGHGFAQAGLIGSQTKWTRFRNRLQSLGHSPTQISRITCPIGDPSLGKHPQAIAVGVASCLLSHSSTQTLGKGVAR